MKIEWNKVTWYSKLIALILFVALPFIGFYYGTQYGKTVALIGQVSTAVSTTTVTSLPAYYSDTAEWQADNNNAGFSISYPIDFTTQDSNGIFTLTVPKSFEPQTNFADATLTASQCSTAPDQSGEPTVATSSVTITGILFTTSHSSDAGAGNIYQTTSYRTTHNGECYAIEYTVHSSQIANYPASYNLQPFNESTIDLLMQNIVGTFKFD